MKSSTPRAIAAFLILFGLYQSAEGIGGLLLDNFAVQASLMILAVVAAWPVGRYLLRRRGWDAYALEWRGDAARLLIGGLLLAAAAKALALLIGTRIGAYTVGPADGASGMALAGAILLALVSTFIASIAEDIVTRGFWWRATALRGSALVVASSLIYVLNHIYRLQNGPAEWAMLFCFGLAYAAALARTGSLWAAVGLHWGWNLSNALLDQFASVDGNPALTPWLSAAAHLAMLAVILLLPRRPGVNRAS